MKSIRLVVLVGIVSVVSGCRADPYPAPGKNSASEIRAAQKLVLFSLDPLTGKGPQESVTNKTVYHGYPILGQMEITDPQRIADIADIMQDSRNRAEKKYLMCFNPRHGIRVISASQAIDYLVCFECLSCQTFASDYTAIKDEVDRIADNSKRLNAILTNAGVPLPTN